MTEQPPEMKTFVIWDFELEELTYGDRLDTKKQLNKDIRSRHAPATPKTRMDVFEAFIGDHLKEHDTAIRQQEHARVLPFLEELASSSVSDARKREILESLRTTAPTERK